MGQDKQATSAPAATGPGTAAAAPPGKRTRSERLPGRPGDAPGRPGTAEQACLEEYGDQLPDAGTREATGTMEGGGPAAHTVVRDERGRVKRVAKRFHDRFSNTSVVVFVELSPPAHISDERARALADADADAVYQRWLRDRVNLVSQLCAQREPIELTAPTPLTVTEPDGEPDRPPPSEPPAPGEPDQPPTTPRPGAGGATTSVTLPAVHFANGSAEPLDLPPVIARLRELHRERPGGIVRLDGHASSVGADRFNLRLSADRVAAVRRALAAAIPGLAVPERPDEAHGERAAMETEGHKRGAELERAREHNRRVDVRFDG
jgi:outer membrane protein OmpA-like peptidoglycan-associated protein